MRLQDRGFIPVPAGHFEIDRLLVLTGLVASRSEAQRLVKAGAVSWRKMDKEIRGEQAWEMDWQKVADFRQELNAGWPWTLRVGNGNWRAGRPGLMMVMRPCEEQMIDFWNEMWL
jgi:hypothetical protein